MKKIKSQQFFSYLTSHSALHSMHMYFRDHIQLECRNALMWGCLLGALQLMLSLQMTHSEEGASALPRHVHLMTTCFMNCTTHTHTHLLMHVSKKN